MLKVLLFASFLAMAASQCSLYFDDCQACLSDSECGWCGDYCTSKDSAFCDVKMLHDANLCPSPDSVNTAVKRQSSCAAATGCAACIAVSGCSWCTVTLNDGGHSTSCVPTDLCESFYAHSDSAETKTDYCGSIPSSVPLSDLIDFVLVFSGNQDNKGEIASGISSSFDLFYSSQAATKTISGANVKIIGITLVQGSSLKRDERQGSTNTRCVFTVVAPESYGGGQSQCNTDVENWLDSLTLGVAIAPGLVPVGKSGPPPASSSSSSLSGGDLAAIIIACIIGAALIAAILLWVLLLRRKGGHPAPFRSPAAAFRP